MVNKRFTLQWIEVGFDWYDWYDDETFGLGISCLDPGDNYSECDFATYVDKDMP